MLYSLQPPYVIEGVHEPRGYLPDMLKLILNVCCYGCSHVTFVGPVGHVEKFKAHNNITFFMPVESALGSDMLLGVEYIGLIVVHRYVNIE